MAIEHLLLQSGDRLLIIGIGTGADLPLLPEKVGVIGIDLSPAMLRQARKKTVRTSAEVQLIVADAANLPLKTGKFDRVLLALILSVIPDPQACLAEVTRVTSPDCKIVVLDKFLHRENPTFLRRLANVVIRLFGTDINRKLESMLVGSPFVIVSRKPAAFGRAYEVIELRHESCTAR
ncbi:MAG: methyltransferase domain-containing protein [Planctomycetaceae bacterium]|nr:methyltransferase domain-containing protein [Planctomycetaceae bacterium]